MADDSENSEDKGFKVRDRRRFSSESGEPVENAESEAGSQVPNQEPIIPPVEKKESTTDEALPAINFPTFIISLSTQALMHLGEIPNFLLTPPSYFPTLPLTPRRVKKRKGPGKYRPTLSNQLIKTHHLQESIRGF